jgi:plastocyanin
MNKIGILLLVLGWAMTRAAIVPVSIVNFTYVADTAVVTQGDSVVWTNNGTSPHTTTSGAAGVPDGLWNSGTLSPGLSFGRTFSQVGDFPYYCAIHYPINHMAGLIRVHSAGIEDGASKKTGSLALSAEPNPFSDRVMLNYRLSGTERSVLTVYSGSGRLVRTIFSGHSATGERTVSWDGRDRSGMESSAGVYLAILQTGADAAVLRLVKLN